MARARPNRKDHQRLLAETAQVIRLQGLNSGRYEPECSREWLYLYLLRHNERPDIEDFIVSEPLWRLERIEREFEASDSAE